jgi:hypothetical protein
MVTTKKAIADGQQEKNKRLRAGKESKMANDHDRLTPAPVGSKDAYHLAISDGGVVLPGNLGDMIEFARMMAKADIAIPKHLRGNAGACLAVAMRARAWTMDPFAIATKTYAVNDILAYEAQLIVAVINKFAPIVGRLVPRYVGEDSSLKCFIEPKTREDGQVLPYESPEVKDIGVKNSPLWKNDVRQQLFYSSARAWARRYYPELLLGVYDVEEARTMKDVSPPKVVDNMLNDDPPDEALEGEIQDRLGHPIVIETKARLNESVEHSSQTAKPDGEAGEEVTDSRPSPAEPAHDKETGELFDETVITPELIAENLIKSIKGINDKLTLETWQHENQVDINAQKGDLGKKVRKALSDRHIDLETL